ncbi:fatty acyl-AMP ligase [Mycobacterium heckeshornense]|uniref:fatty acyl-AMP ligase n=1 Tax=Mycobacterium heckeshornense TaxID=110505 RepID=UPI001C404550|nr:fatty acyl-AMP ligase [Mycobacterium heckeshornense]
MTSVPNTESGDPRTSLRPEDYLDANGDIALPAGVNLMSLLERNIAEFGDFVAYRYLDYAHSVEGQAVELTWAQLGIRVQAVSARLRQVTAPGDRVAVLAPQGLDYIAGFFAAIRAGNIAVPLFAPELPGHAERLDAVLGDAQPTVVLTTASASEAVHAFLRKLAPADRPRVIAIDHLPDAVGEASVPAPFDTDDVAYLQYTSGSTRTPTGVEITHRAAGTNLLQMILSLGLDPETRGVSWLPLYHDMGLMMIGFPVLYGGHVTLMSPMAFIRRPLRWMRALAAESRQCRVVTAAPNFAFELVAQRGLPAMDERLDLSNVVLINGSEPVSMDSMRKFTKAFEPYGLATSAIKPSYGMAEATLFVSTIGPGVEPTATYLDREQLAAGHAVRVPADDPHAMPLVSCGRISRSQWGVIVDPDTGEELPDGEVGEIWLHGDNIGRGYWARPQETRLAFANTLRSRLPEGSHADGAPLDASWLRTGDLGVYLDGELYITGRIKDLVIIDGRNHYPQDIEATAVEASPAVRPGHVAAFSVSVDELPAAAHAHGSGEALVIVAERAAGAGRADPQPVIDAIRAAVSRRHGLPVADVKLVAAGVIPRTTSGKLARRECRAQYLSGRLGGSPTSSS